MTRLATTRIHTGRVVALDVDTVRLPNGTVAEFEMLRHPGAAAVLPFLDDPGDPDPRILLIRQYRHATGEYLWEIPAGRRDGTEPPDATAHRELAEETGYRAARLRHLTAIWTTPGFTDEVIHLYAAAGLTAGASDREADEVLEVHPTRWSAALEMIHNGTISDTKTVGAILFVQCYKSYP